MLQALAAFLAESPTCYHAADAVRRRLDAAGFSPWAPGAPLPGKSFYAMLGGTSLLAFRLPDGKPTGFSITASHCDSPCFKLRTGAEESGGYTRLRCERYGGMLPGSWLDRPLGIAGRVLVRTDRGVEARLVDLGPAQVLIPSVAIHLNREAGSGAKFDFARDFYPLYGLTGGQACLQDALARAACCDHADILASDLFVYNGQRAYVWGAADAFFTGPRLDDLACCFACLEGFLEAEASSAVAVLGIFDHEEIGSDTRQGAGSAFLSDTLRAVTEAPELSIGEHRLLLQNSFSLSCDNGHAVHPNHPELADAAQAPQLGQGVVVKHSPRYATDGMAEAVFAEICRRAQVPLQHYANRPDQPGGATLGNIAATKTPVLTVDIGMAQLSMHASLETIGAADLGHFVRAVAAFYGASIHAAGDYIAVQ